ncbi:hypothetical protein AXG55_14250 [Silvanigrella aquatica]|uniref:Uncharacterized protein n=1 Tax=Silvanigrella aquatica TaxID=1915309 RepID=A0A1L4D472_9BACT|nr:hypothetical protein AXG55_14250 [Silvanigrella aquatica]
MGLNQVLELNNLNYFQIHSTYDQHDFIFKSAHYLFCRQYKKTSSGHNYEDEVFLYKLKIWGD